MGTVNQCPICQKSKLKRIGRTLICECGWHHSEVEDVEPFQGSLAALMGLVTLFIAITAFHVFQWGQYSLAVFVSKPQKMVEICKDLKKYNCVEKSLQKSYTRTKKIEYLVQLGEIQFKREKYEESAQTFKEYFSRRGDSFKAKYYYANALSKINQVDEATRVFEEILQSRRGVIMVTVVDSYLAMLVSHNQKEKAKRVIDRFARVSSHVSSAKSVIKNWKKKFDI